MDTKKLQHELDRAKIKLMSNKEATFFTNIMLSLKFFWDEDHKTAWTDGYRMGFNPGFFMGMPEDERVGVLVHEASHVAYDHMGRLMGRNMRMWNIACDHVINLYLLERGFRLPAFRLADERFTGMSAEEVYAIIMKEPEPPGNPMEDLRVNEQVTTEEYKKHVEDIIIRAATLTKLSNSPHTIPGEVEIFLGKLLKPKLPWTQIFKRELDAAVKRGQCWSKPHRRHFPDMMLPSKWSKAPSDATFYVDTSCSVTDEQFTIFVGEIVGAFRMFKFEKITIVQFDTEIHSVNVVKSIAELRKVKFEGRGGTHIGCILDHMEKTKPKLSIVFTDGGFGWPRKEFKQNILWLINDNPSWQPLFGRAIHFDT